MNYVIIVISILIAFIVLQYYHINKVSNDFEILQADNPNKDEFEKILSSRNPSIFTNVSKTKPQKIIQF